MMFLCIRTLRTAAMACAAIAVIGLTACTGHRITTDWATIGVTPRAALKARFGEPAEYYENGKILAYRVVRHDRGYTRYDEAFTLGPPGIARYNLIFTFNNDGLLENISRIELKD